MTPDALRPTSSEAERDAHEHALTPAEHDELWAALLASPSDEPAWDLTETRPF